jgi:hypothetical protein
MSWKMAECPAGPGVQGYRWNLHKAEKALQIRIPNSVFYSVVSQGATELGDPRRRFRRLYNRRMDENHGTSSFIRLLPNSKERGEAVGFQNFRMRIS